MNRRGLNALLPLLLLGLALSACGPEDASEAVELGASTQDLTRAQVASSNDPIPARNSTPTPDAAGGNPAPTVAAANPLIVLMYSQFVAIQPVDSSNDPIPARVVTTLGNGNPVAPNTSGTDTRKTGN